MVAQAHAEGRVGSTEAAKGLGIDESIVREWVERYMAHGAE